MATKKKAKKAKVLLIKSVETKTGYKLMSKLGSGKWRTYRHPAKRQSEINPLHGILHIQVGLANIWEPTPEEVDGVAELFMAALENPGAVVATRQGVVSEWIMNPLARV